MAGQPGAASAVCTGMRRHSAKRMALAAVLAVLGLLGWLVIEWYPAPEVDAELAEVVLPLIDEQLERGPWPGLLTTARPDLKPRWFCAEQVIETRRDGAVLRVGLVALCVEYGRLDDALLEGSGERSPKLAVLTGGPDRWEVIRVESPPDGHAATEWEREHFSPAATKRLDRHEGAPAQSDDIAAQARLVFGLPPDFPGAAQVPLHEIAAERARVTVEGWATTARAARHRRQAQQVEHAARPARPGLALLIRQGGRRGG